MAQGTVGDVVTFFSTGGTVTNAGVVIGNPLTTTTRVAMHFMGYPVEGGQRVAGAKTFDTTSVTTVSASGESN